MTEAYNEALSEQIEKGVWDQLAAEATNLSKLEVATLTADVAGIFDPTPISDTAGLVLSAVQLDGWGVLFSAAGYIPYIGDAVGKPAKIAKRAPKTAKAIEAILGLGDELAGAGKAALKAAGLTLDGVAAARKKALERVRKAMLDARNKVPNCQDCKKLVNADGKKSKLVMPDKKNGSWVGGKQPKDGNGIFEFNEPKTLPDGRVIDRIEYKDGSPDFSEYVEGSKHDLWEVTGNVTKDEKSLKELMRQQDPNWSPPSSKDYTLHHFEDGTVGYVPSSIHNVAEGGVAHTGSRSMMDNELF